MTEAGWSVGGKAGWLASWYGSPVCPTWGAAAGPDAGGFWGADRGSRVGKDGPLSFWEVAAGVGTEGMELWAQVGAGDSEASFSN